MAALRKLPAKVRSVEEHAPGLFTVELAPEGRVPRFKAGQFLHLALDTYDPSRPWPESRVFSIANSPTRRDTLKITYNVQGKFTQRMAAELVVGATVWTKLPYGSFYIAPEAEREIVLIAGGTGVTPFLSYLEYALDTGEKSPVRLFYGIRSLGLETNEQLLRACEAGLEDFRIERFVEQVDGELPEGVRVGRLNLPDISGALENPAEAVFYLSGPVEMIQAFRAQLKADFGIPEDRIKVDDWV